MDLRDFLIYGSLLTLHVSRGNDANLGLVVTQRERDVQPMVVFRLAECVPARLRVTVRNIILDQQRSIEKHLLRF
jgi:hypothetical protein